MLLLAVALAMMIPPVSPAAAATPQTFEIEAGRELGLLGSDGAPLSAVTVRFLPEEIEVHKGDTLHFTSFVPLQSVALLPPTVGECSEWKVGRCKPRDWLEDYAFSLESPWYPVTLDPDETHVKVNNAAAFPPFPPCGNPGQGGPCSFPLTPSQQEAQDTRWGFAKPETPDGAKGVLSSGIRQGGVRTVDFRVQITAEPGTDLWVVAPFAKEAHLRVRVVDDAQAIPSPEQVKAAGESLFQADRATAAELDARYATHRKVISRDRGVATWEAFLGLEDGPVAIRQPYPKILDIRQGDRVRWSAERVLSLVHTVTFQGGLAFALDAPFYTTQCDLDGDDGTYPDQEAVFPEPVFCPGGHRQVEFDLHELIGASDGDGVFKGLGDDEHSGVRGMAPDLVKAGWPTVLPREHYELQFPVKSGAAGFQYACVLHGALEHEMSGTVVVR